MLFLLRKNGCRRAIASLLLTVIAAGACSAVASESESMGMMSKADYAFMYGKTSALQERWSAIEEKVKKKLPEQELFTSQCMFDALYNLDIRSDWKSLEAMLKKCKTADDFIDLLHTDFSGINQGEEGEPQREDLDQPVGEALRAAGFDDMAYRVYTKPTPGQYPFYGTPDWYVHAGSANGAKKKQWPHVVIGIDEAGKVLQLDSVGYLPDDMKTAGTISEKEWEAVVTSALRFIDKHALIVSKGIREIEGFHMSFVGAKDDPYAELYIYYGLEIDEDNADVPAQKIGYNLRVGVKTGRIYSLLPLVEEISLENT